MHTLEIDGIAIEFPFQPYNCQVKFMEKVMEALKTGQNAALESPTGTGKTLCLLCAAIAYLKDCKSKITQIGALGELQGTSSRSLYPKVLYVSRTHSQLAQVVRELNKTTYKDIKTVTLGSRDLLCINDKVMNESNSHVKSLMCRNLVSKRQCPYYNQYDKADPTTLDILYTENGVVPDIEDVINISKKYRYCPYFRTRTMFENADLILLPYNYIIDPSLRHKHNIELKGNIVIFDEAHNLESICEESTSVSFSTTQLSGCLREAKKVLEMLVNDEEEIRTKMDNTVTPFGAKVQKTEDVKVEKNDVACLLAFLQQLEDVVDEFKKQKGMKLPRIDGKVHPGETMADLLAKAGFRKDMKEAFSLTVDKIGQYLTSKAENGPTGEIFVDKGVHLQEFASFISIVYADTHDSLRALGSRAYATKNAIAGGEASSCAQYFQLYVTEHGSVTTLNYWCFSPSVAIWYLYGRGVRSMIMTSGTLSPLDPFVNSLGVNVGITLENEHAASMDQILGARIRRSQRGIDLCGSFLLRSTNRYINGIGEVVLRACEIIPEGVLVFFSSYVSMNSCLKLWKTQKSGLTPIWDRITKHKEIFVEPKSKVELKAVMLQFREKVKDGNGAALFAVCRAKVSEGIDFVDNESRGVIVIGVPYAPTTNPRIELKKQFLAKQRAGACKEELKKYISADEWYQVDAVRAVNQSIGRVLRHKDDFGVVILVDSRFCSMPPKRFPSWMRDCLKTYNSVDCFESECARFFQERSVKTGAINKKMTLAIERSSSTASCRKRNEISVLKIGRDKELGFDIAALYSSEAVAAFTNSSCLEDTLSKRPKRSCIFDEIEESAKNEDSSIENTISSNTTEVDFPTPGEFVKKGKPKLRLKLSVSPSIPNDLSCTGSSITLEENEMQNTATASNENIEEVMNSWKMSALEYNGLLQEVEKSKRNALKRALTNYATSKDFHSLISTFTAETVPGRMKLFKGLYSYLQAEHRTQFAIVCRRMKLF